MVRLMIGIQPYNPKISYVQGKKNNLANYPSRLNGDIKILTCSVDIISETDNKVEYFTSAELIEEQHKDEIYKNIIQKLKTKKLLTLCLP